MRNKKQKASRQTRTAAVLRTSDPKIRTKIKYNNNGGKTEGVVQRGVMSLEIFISTKRKKMKLITLATKRASKKVKCYRQYKRAKDIIKESIIKESNGSEQKDWWKRPPSKTFKMNTKRKESNGSEHKDWWKRQASWKMNTKRKILKGSTDVYLLKRTIELEID